ncbi:chromosomal replication initiator protein DnaA [Candidatus Saccharibacteria bacterium]|nr:MAG: chromosomal replication initiator protein DnaA [Candidatus Saccharibacteria bacterium]PID99206.1 MAG: chromosomal replication initiator protein DnaA [Candidatus Saccharibacteria bacterium]
MHTVNYDQLWRTVQGEVEISLSRGNYITWFKNTRLIQVDKESATLGVQNVFVKQQFEGKYRDMVLQTLAKNGVHVSRLNVKIQPVTKTRESDDELITNAVNSAKTAANSTSTQPSARQRSGLAHAYRQGVNEKYRFENFIVGSGNELAYAACQAVAADLGNKYNPLFLYGGVGIGKTHLIQAVGNEILANRPGSHVVYVSSEQFVQEFVDALRFKKNTDFADYYRGADVLIVDDVQFLAGKEKIQEEFFHTFNALHQANKQIIISSDKPPKDIPTLEERLRSRFVWGMSIDMQNPDFETRCAIIQSKAEEKNISLPHDVVEYLSTQFQTNIRELEGALNQVLAFCEMRGLAPNLAIVSGLLGSGRGRPKHLSARQIIERCAKYYQVAVEDMLGPKRDKDIVTPRQIAMYLLRSELHLSFPKIAQELGRKDHTTAIHSVEKIEKETDLNPAIRTALADIKERLYA